MALKIPKPDPPRYTMLIGVATRRGSMRITRLVAPALRVVREPGKPPRLELCAPRRVLVS